jgi:G3E family GTPase
MSETGRIPVIVIGGFLGAGKTSWLNRWLLSLPFARVAVLVNDFGEINIDASLIAATEGETIALTNGCICCQMGGDLSQALIRLLSHPQPFDAVVIEASGVSDPGRIARLARAAPELELKGVLVLVDATSTASRLQDPQLGDTLQAQIRSADWLLLSKTDISHGQQVSELRELLHALAPETPCIETGWLPTGLAGMPDAGRALDRACLPAGHGRRFSVWTGCPQVALSGQEWIRRLEALPGQVLRLKGFVRTHEHGWASVQRAGQQVSLAAWAGSAPAQLSLVAVSLRGSTPRETLDALLHA